MPKSALLLIDVQMAMFTYAPLYRGPQVLQNLKQLIAAARRAGVPVVYIQHSDDDLREETPEWAIHPDIGPQRGEPVVAKHRSDSFYHTELAAVLKKLGARRLILCGMQTDFCVDTTCRAAFSRDYEVVLVSDAHSTFDNEAIPAAKIVAHHNRILRGFARIATTAEVVDELRIEEN